MNARKFAAVLAFTLSSAAASATQDLPEGKWWKRPRVATEIGLTAEQSRQIDGIFSRARPTLIDLKADLEKKQGELQDALEVSDANRSDVELRVEAVEGARAELQKARIRMLLEMRRVLKPEQWSRLMELHEAARRQRGMRMNRFGDRRRPSSPDRPPR